MLFLVLHRIDKELDLKILYLFKIDVKAASVKGIEITQPALQDFLPPLFADGQQLTQPPFDIILSGPVFQPERPEFR